MRSLGSIALMTLATACSPGSSDKTVTTGATDTGSPATDTTTPPTTTDTGTPPTTEPVDEAALLADLELAKAEYATWGQAPGWEGVVATAGGAHGPAVQIWYDDAALAALAKPTVGATAFKEAYADPVGATLSSVTAMRLVDAYGWFYAEWDATGALVDSGRPAMCVGCHESVAANGFLAGG